jgi:hypothetical protein
MVLLQLVLWKLCRSLDSNWNSFLFWRYCWLVVSNLFPTWLYRVPNVYTLDSAMLCSWRWKETSHLFHRIWKAILVAHAAVFPFCLLCTALECEQSGEKCLILANRNALKLPVPDRLEWRMPYSVDATETSSSLPDGHCIRCSDSDIIILLVRETPYYHAISINQVDIRCA